MTQYNSLNVKLPNSQLNKLKSSIKNKTDVVLRISSNMLVIQMIILIFLGSGATSLIISNDEMDDILKIVKSLENSGVLLKGVSEIIQN